MSTEAISGESSPGGAVPGARPAEETDVAIFEVLPQPASGRGHRGQAGLSEGGRPWTMTGRPARYGRRPPRRRARAAQPRPSRPRAFNDSARVASLECDAWVAYYQRRWLRLLVAAVGLVRAGLGMSWPRTTRAAWYVLRAIMFWAPLRDNDPPRAQAYMQRFYELVKASRGQPQDPAESAHLEIEWWRVHRVARPAAARPERRACQRSCAPVCLRSGGTGTGGPGRPRSTAAGRWRSPDQWVARGEPFGQPADRLESERC